MGFVIYVAIGIIISFFAYWYAYRDRKEKMIEEAGTYRKPPTHDEIKDRTLSDACAVVFVAGFFWPVTVFIVTPIFAFAWVVTSGFTWAIDRLEGGEKKKKEDK